MGVLLISAVLEDKMFLFRENQNELYLLKILCMYGNPARTENTGAPSVRTYMYYVKQRRGGRGERKLSERQKEK